MYEAMMYAGAIGCIVFFILSVVLFIKNKIPSSIMYFVNLRRKGVDIWSAEKKQGGRQKKKSPPETDAGGGGAYEPTEYLDEAGAAAAQTGNAAAAEVYEPTEYLDEAENSPTELLP